MQIVKWPIPIIGKLADNRPIIGAPLVNTEQKCWYKNGQTTEKHSVTHNQKLAVNVTTMHNVH